MCPALTSIFLRNQHIDRSTADLPLHILLTVRSVTGLSTPGTTPLRLGKVMPLPADVFIFSFETIDSARLYVGVGAFQNPSIPTDESYFGWIEFSQKGSAQSLRIDLSNLNLHGLPLSICGITSSGEGFRLEGEIPTRPHLKKSPHQEPFTSQHLPRNTQPFTLSAALPEAAMVPNAQKGQETCRN